MFIASLSAFVLLISLGTVRVARADPACVGLSPDQGPLGYQRRTNGDRCEGFFKSNVAGEALTVAFLMSGRVPASAELVVSGAGPKLEINVRAIALPLGTYYRMDATVAPNKPLRWPLSEVVQAGHSLKNTDLGLYGWLETAGRKTYVPIRASAPGDPPAVDPTFRLGVRANVAVERVVYSISSDETCHFGNQAWKELATNVRTGAVLTLLLPEDRPVFCVGFRAKLPDVDSPEPATVRIRLR